MTGSVRPLTDGVKIFPIDLFITQAYLRAIASAGATYAEPNITR